MTRRRTATVVAGAGLLLVLAAGCGDAADPVSEGTSAPSSTSPDDNRGGFGPPVAQEGEFDVIGTAVLAGDLELDDRGCWWLEGNGSRAVIVLPPGFDVAPSGTAVVTADGGELGDGAAVQGTGGQIGADAVPGGPDGRWSGYIGFCGGPDTGAVVTSSLGAAPDLSTLDDGELTALVVDASLDTDWPCGYGFAVSTDDQQVGLYVTPTVGDVPEAGPVTLPDDRFSVTVVVGSNLFVNHCDDVAEWLEPSREVAAQWPVVAGSFVYDPPTTDGICAASAPTATKLEGAVVDSPVGPVELGPVELENTAFGCFAG